MGIWTFLFCIRDVDAVCLDVGKGASEALLIHIQMISHRVVVKSIFSILLEIEQEIPDFRLRQLETT